MKEYVFALAGGIMASMYHYMFVMRPAMTVRQAELDRVWRDVDMIKLNNKAKEAKSLTFPVREKPIQK